MLSRLNTKSSLELIILVSIFMISCEGGKISQKTIHNETIDESIKSVSSDDNGAPLKQNISYNSVIQNPQKNYLVNFTDSQGNVIKSLDARKYNPFNNLEYPLDFISDDEIDFQYDLSNLNKSSKENIISGMRINTDAEINNTQLFKMYIKEPAVETNDRAVVFGYCKMFYTSEEDILGTQGIAIIFDGNGNEKKRIIDSKDGFYDLRISSNGKYLLQKYGFNYGEDGGSQLENGFKFYDIDSGAKIFEIDCGKDQFISGYNFLFDTHYATYIRREGNRHEKYIIDLSNNSIYKKTMDRKKYANDLNYKKSLFPNFLKTFHSEDLIKDGFQKM